MNIFLVLDLGDGRVELATPPLEGTILPGITRDSLLEIARGFDGVQARGGVVWDGVEVSSAGVQARGEGGGDQHITSQQQACVPGTHAAAVLARCCWQRAWWWSWTSWFPSPASCL